MAAPSAFRTTSTTEEGVAAVQAQPVPVQALRLLPATQLLGPTEGSGLREPPCYIRRPDDQVVQLSPLLFEFARAARPGTSEAEIAERAGAALDARVTTEQVRYVLEKKLHPLGVVAGPDGSEPELARLDPLLGVHLRVGAIRPATMNAIGRVLAPLFQPVVVACMLLAFVAVDMWLFALHGIGNSINSVIDQPTIGLLLLLILYASMVFHECGHAAACRYSGGRCGGMGMGLFIVWPALFTDVTESYRFDRRGRLRTDLGGIYFNGIYALAIAAAYALTGWEPLLLAVVAQHVQIFSQFLPWMRLDGYYVVADLIGVPDLFARVRPVLRSLIPGRGSDPRVVELKPWARYAVTGWVLTAMVAVNAFLIVMVLNSPVYISRAWTSLFTEAGTVAAAASAGRVLDVVGACVGAVLLVLPVVGMTIIYLQICRRLGTGLAVFRARPLLAAAQAAAREASRAA